MARQTLLGLSGWCVALVVLLCGAGSGSDLRVRRLLIEDDDGKVKMELGTVAGRAAISLMDDEGATRFKVRVTKGGCPLLYMSSAGGKAEVMIGIAENGWPVASNKTRDGTAYRYVVERRELNPAESR